MRGVTEANLNKSEKKTRPILHELDNIKPSQGKTPRTLGNSTKYAKSKLLDVNRINSYFQKHGNLNVSQKDLDYLAESS